MAKADHKAFNIVVPVLGWSFLTVGLLVLLHTAGKVVMSVRIQRWVETPAKVSQLELQERVSERNGTRPRHRWRKRYSYAVQTQYNYQWQGKVYQGSRFAVQTLEDNSAKYHADHVGLVKRRIGKDGSSHCYVNPANPSESVLSRECRWTSLSQYSLFGLLFLTIGAGLAFLTSRKEQAAEAARQAAHPGEAWMWREDWALGEATNGAAFPSRVIGCAAAWLVATGIPLVLSFVYPAQVQESSSFVVYIAPLPAILLIWLAVHFARDFRTFGVLRLKLDRVPVYPGEVLSAHLVVPVPMAGATRVKHTITCTRREEGGGRKGRKTSVQRELVRMEWETPPPATGADGTCRLDMRIDIPADIPGMDPRGAEDAVKWELELEADLPGIEFENSFSLPVFNRDADPVSAPG